MPPHRGPHGEGPGSVRMQRGKGKAWTRGVTVVSSEKNQESGCMGFGLASLNKCSRPWDVGPGEYWPWAAHPGLSCLCLGSTPAVHPVPSLGTGWPWDQQSLLSEQGPRCQSIIKAWLIQHGIRFLKKDWTISNLEAGLPFSPMNLAKDMCVSLGMYGAQSEALGVWLLLALLFCVKSSKSNAFLSSNFLVHKVDGTSNSTCPVRLVSVETGSYI